MDYCEVNDKTSSITCIYAFPKTHKKNAKFDEMYDLKYPEHNKIHESKELAKQFGFGWVAACLFCSIACIPYKNFKILKLSGVQKKDKKKKHLKVSKLLYLHSK